MSFLLRLAGSYVDAVLNTFYPLEREPSMADLNADGLADKEAEEEVSEPVLRSESAFHTWEAPKGDWPEEPDPLSHLIALVEDICNIVSSAAPSVAESPGSAVPPANPGHLISWEEMHDAAVYLWRYSAERAATDEGREAFALSNKLHKAVQEMKVSPSCRNS